MKSPAAALFFQALCLLAFPIIALASAGGGENGPGMMSFFSSGFLWSLINFAVIAFVLYWFGKGPMKEALANRQKTIEKALNEAAEARAAAEKGLEEARKRFSEKDGEVAALLDDSKEAAERQKAQLVEQGRRMSQDIVERARLSVNVELERAKADLKAEAVQLAVELAERKIREQTSDEDQKRLQSGYIDKMENSN